MVTKRSKDDKKSKAVAAGARPAHGRHAAPAAPSGSASQGASQPGAQQAPRQGQGIPQQKVAAQPPVRAAVPQSGGAQKAPVQPAHQAGAQSSQASASAPVNVQQPTKKPSPRSMAPQPQQQAKEVSKSVKAQASHGSRGAKPAKQKKRRIPLPVKIVLSIVLVAAIAAAAFLVWDYLFRYDDAADFQGQWKIEGSNASIVITEDEIRLTDSVSFTYELNTFEKSITYNFANYSGKGMYVFSPERDVLTLTDVTPSPDEGDTQQSMSLLKVSNQAIGEPEVANNNTAENADTTGVDVVDGSETAQQAEENE